MRCCGITKAGSPCRSYPLFGRDHCKWHGPFCQGTCRDGRHCGSLAKPEFDWLYCRVDHVPCNTRSTDPQVFRIGSLRNLRSDAVLEWRDGKDAYTGDQIKSIKGKDLDHVVEIHVVRDAFDAIPKHGMNFETNKKNLLEFAQSSAVNENFNLNFTSKDINQIKFRSFQAFQEDYRKGTVEQAQGLFPYLEGEFHCSEASTAGSLNVNDLFLPIKSCNAEPRKFSRKVSANIQREVKTSFDDVVSAFEEEQPLHGHMKEKLDDIKTAMRLL